MLEQQLQNLGLSKNETTVYLSLFDLGKCKAGQIIEHTGLHRNLVYTALENLIRQNLISKIISENIAVFEANSPTTILNSIEEKKSLAEEVIQQLKKKQTETPRDINVYDGIEGIKKTREQVTNNIQAGEIYHILGISDNQTHRELDPFFAKNNTTITNKGAIIKALYDQSSSPNLLHNRKLKEGTQAKKLPFGAESPMWITFFQDILNISILGNSPVTFSIRSKEAVKGFTDYFEYFWNQKVTAESGIKVLEKTIYEMLNELKPGEEYLVLGASFGGQADIVQKLYDQFHTDRIKKGVITKMLVYKESYELIKNRFYKSGDPFFKVSFLKPFVSAPPIPMQINLYKDKMYIILYDKEPLVLKFDRKDIYEGFKKYFDEFWNQETVTFVGKLRVETAYNEIISLANQKEDVIIFAAKPKDPLMAEFNIDWAKRLSEKCRKIKYIYYGNTIENVKRANEIKKRIQKSEVKIISTNQSLPISNVIVGDTTLNTIWSEEPVCLITKNKTVADSLKENFNLLWNQETQILKGPLELQKIFFECIEAKELRQIGARGYFIDRYPELFKPIREKALKTPGIKWKNIVDIKSKGNAITKLPWVETKYNLSEIKNPNVIWLYGEKVVVANWAGDEPIIFSSTNKHLIQSYSDYFEELWNK